MKKTLTLRYSLHQCAYWAAAAGIMTFATTFLLAKNFPASQVGVLMACGSVLSGVTQPLLAARADRAQRRDRHPCGGHHHRRRRRPGPAADRGSHRSLPRQCPAGSPLTRPYCRFCSPWRTFLFFPTGNIPKNALSLRPFKKQTRPSISKDRGPCSF